MYTKLYTGFLVLTHDCNNRCRWCYELPTGFKKRYMEFEKAKGFLRLMKSLGITTIGWLGGEPALHPNIFELTEFAKNLGFKVTLYTNGRILSNEKFCKRFKDIGLDFVNLSVQSGSRYKEEHDKVVNVRGAWDETFKGVKNAHKYGLKINFQTVISHTNIDIYRDIIDEFAPYANIFIFYRLVPIVKLSRNFFEEKVISNKDTKEMYKKIFLYGKEKGVRTYFFSRMPLCWWNENDPVEKEIHKQVVAHCHILNGTNLTIDVDGRVLPCANWAILHSANLVRNGLVVSREKFLNIFNFGTPAKIRKKLTYVPDKRCLKCKWFGKRCSGGCPLVKFEIGPYAPHTS